MKELWSYLGRLFQGAWKNPWKQIRKAADSAAYESAVAQIFARRCGQGCLLGGRIEGMNGGRPFRAVRRPVCLSCA